jgi:hypothetical protein
MNVALFLVLFTLGFSTARIPGINFLDSTCLYPVTAKPSILISFS